MLVITIIIYAVFAAFFLRFIYNADGRRNSETKKQSIKKAA